MRYIQIEFCFVSGCQLKISEHPLLEISGLASLRATERPSVPRDLPSNWRARAPALSTPEPAGWGLREAAASGLWPQSLACPRDPEPQWGLSPGIHACRLQRLQLTDHRLCQGGKLYASRREAFCPQSVLEQNLKIQKRVCCEFQECFPGSGFCACEVD